MFSQLLFVGNLFLRADSSEGDCYRNKIIVFNILDLRINLHQTQANDGNQITGPIIRARARGLQNLTLRVFSDSLEIDEVTFFTNFGINVNNSYYNNHLLMICEVDEGKMGIRTLKDQDSV